MRNNAGAAFAQVRYRSSWLAGSPVHHHCAYRFAEARRTTHNGTMHDKMNCGAMALFGGPQKFLRSLCESFKPHDTHTQHLHASLLQ